MTGLKSCPTLFTQDGNYLVVIRHSASVLLPMSDYLWRTTTELCPHLIHQLILHFTIQRSGVLKDGQNLVAKIPTNACSHRLRNGKRSEQELGGLLMVEQTITCLSTTEPST